MTWPLVPLADVAEVQGGIQKQPKRAPRNNAFPFLRVANVTASGLDLREIHEIELFDGELDRYRLRRGDLLVVEGNGSASQIGRAAVWDGSIIDAVHQNHLIRVRPAPDLNARFLGLLWNSPTVRKALSEVASSTSGLHTLSVAKLKRVMIPVPPLDEQRRSVELLDDHLSRLAAADAYLDVAQRRAVTLHDQVLSSELDATAGEAIALGELLTARLANGKSVPTQDGGFPVLRLTALRGGRVDLTERKAGAWSADQAAPFLVQRGDFLIARGNGSLRLVGRGGLVIDDPDPVAYPDTLIRARLNASLVSPQFVALVWNAPAVRRQIENAARTTAGIYKVNQKDLAAVKVPVPSLADQERVVDAVTLARERLTRLTTEVSRSQTRGVALRRSLLAAAFAGHLTHRKRQSVADRRADEPVSRTQRDCDTRSQGAAPASVLDDTGVNESTNWTRHLGSIGRVDKADPQNGATSQQ
jgi:type I restriction enzyme, S subunit